MNVIITLAGHSRRFKKAGFEIPKFMIPILGMPIINHVVNTYSDRDSFFFVLNETQNEEFPEIIPYLKSIVKNCHITVVPPHELGPVHSAMSVASEIEGPVIVSYCDFIVTWDYERFLREVAGFDAAVPFFKGFHPASFGHTFYAYMRVDENGLVQELAEKRSFTDQREEEPASAGIYYYSSFELFKEYGQKVIDDKNKPLAENYVSLLTNPLVEDGYKVWANEIKNFICLGTPEDLEQYQFWSKYFTTDHNSNSDTIGIGKELNQTNVLPMAGKGSRFKQFGYRARKPLIQVSGMPMILKACQSFPDAKRWVFLPRSEDFQKYNLSSLLESLNSEVEVMPVEGETSGQAATCLLAKDKIFDVKAPLYIASCDYEIVYNKENWIKLISDKSIDVIIFTTRIGYNLMKDPNSFAYCKVDEDDNVTEVVEKATISDSPGSDPLLLGSFWFRRAEDFNDLAHEIIEKNHHVNGEHYIGNGVNIMIDKGAKVKIFDVDQWISYGDPFELDIYFYWENFFDQFKNFEYSRPGS